MDRPTGVTILAVLHFFGAAAYIFAALGLFALGAGGAMTAAEMPELDGAVAFLLGLGAVLGFILLIFGVLSLALGIGLLKLRNWARVITIVLVGLGLLLSALSLLGSLLSFEIGSFIGDAIFVALQGWMLHYLLQPHVKDAFGVS
ncbi:MAG: hypothetical protein IH789_04155 [Acidobacteria bacterium]|nr:hypothetical protein [Acidobacteriota bacterium]MCH8946807.1 hypothetical protein [Acidobacteriota bacterium]